MKFVSMSHFSGAVLCPNILFHFCVHFSGCILTMGYHTRRYNHTVLYVHYARAKCHQLCIHARFNYKIPMPNKISMGFVGKVLSNNPEKKFKIRKSEKFYPLQSIEMGVKLQFIIAESEKTFEYKSNDTWTIKINSFKNY